jgi:hypothetical protein
MVAEVNTSVAQGLVLEQPYQGLMEDSLAGLDKIDNCQALTDALHMQLPNFEDETDYEAWETASRDVLVNNDTVFRKWMG